MDDLLDEAPSSSSSSSHVGESSSSNLDRGTMTDEGCTDIGGAPRPIAARLYGDCTRSSSTSTSSAAGPSCSSDVATVENSKKKPLNYREKRLAEIRAARLKKYRENAEIVEFKCEENCLAEVFTKYYLELLDDEAGPANLYYRVVESLDVYFRVKTWESNCPKLLCEFLCDHILKTCQQLNELHESKNMTDEWRARECQIQVLLTLHVYVVTDERRWLDEAINKLRMIYISVGAERLRTFVEEPVTDIYLELIGDGLATIYDELCINLPADLIQYDTGLFKMTETDDSLVVKRRNGAANRLEQMLNETSADLGVGGVERARRTSTEAAAPQRRSLKRRNIEDVPKELLSPARTTRTSRSDYKHFFVEDTPDEKYQKKTTKVEEIEMNEEEDGEIGAESTSKRKTVTIKEEIDEEVKQTPMAKLRASAKLNGKRCSKRLSDLVKLSEERTQVTKKARENLNKLLEKANTPIRSVTRPIRKSVLFGSAGSMSSSPATTKCARGTSSRTSLLNKFSEMEEKKKSPLAVDTSDGHIIHTPSSASESTTPVLRDRATRRRTTRFNDKNYQPNVLKQEMHDPEFDAMESSMASPSKRTTKNSSTAASASTTPVSKWTDRQLKRQLGLTREDLNRYREAMLTTGERNRNKNVKINWESAQVNRAGRVKGAGASEDGTPIFGIARRNVRTMICHVLLNDTNPDTSFDWNKVKFDDFCGKPRTRQFQSLIQKPEAYMESLKQKYIESRVSSAKRMRSNDGASTSSRPAKRRRSNASSPKKQTASSSASSTKSLKSPVKLEAFDDFGFESEADD